MHPGIEADLERILCTGESAGGYLAVLSALGQARAKGERAVAGLGMGGVVRRGGIRAVIGAYPVLDVGSEFFSRNLGTQHPMGVPTLPVAVLEDHLAAIKPGDVVSEVVPPERFPLAVAMVQQGRWTEFLGEGEELFPMKIVEEMGKEEAARVPFMFLFHGVDDSAVPVQGSEKFVERVREKLGEGRVIFYAEPGEHGFDAEVGVEERWMRDGLERVTREWLGSE
jgi:acetyl esterase/lipase